MDHKIWRNAWPRREPATYSTKKKVDEATSGGQNSELWWLKLAKRKIHIQIRQHFCSLLPLWKAPDDLAEVYQDNEEKFQAFL